MSAVELLPCPFCGDPMERWGGNTVRHTDFDAKCPIVMQGFMVAQWNRRALIAVKQEAVNRSASWPLVEKGGSIIAGKRKATP